MIVIASTRPGRGGWPGGPVVRRAGHRARRLRAAGRRPGRVPAAAARRAQPPAPAPVRESPHARVEREGRRGRRVRVRHARVQPRLPRVARRTRSTTCTTSGATSRSGSSPTAAWRPGRARSSSSSRWSRRCRLTPVIEQVNIPFYQQFIDDDDGEVHANQVMEQAADAMLDQLRAAGGEAAAAARRGRPGGLSAGRATAAVQPWSSVTGDAGEHLAGRADQEGDHARDLGRLDQLLDRVGLEDHLLEDLLLGQAVRARLVGDLLLDQRRADVGGADRVGGDVVLGALERERLTQPDDAVLGADVCGLVWRGDQAVDARRSPRTGRRRTFSEPARRISQAGTDW